ncbi:hypothetical protein [Citrobacter koseri]|uniref:hypothetical protein n=1 Tax=Citrobacter koseri TaxID=545 RepID=UPI000DFA7A17|nr:hypothetical protein [Citrobacter koseri]STB73270.1 Uncharacterised protein [Citrobacter koseri]STT23450.1 Uncharacterised protein [Citrobacter koseri]
MNSILLSLIVHATAGLNRLYAAMSSRQPEWITNRSGHSGFRTEVVPDNGGFKAVISRRTGYCSREFRYQQCATAGCFASARKAMKAGREMAQQLADLRYRFD